MLSPDGTLFPIGGFFHEIVVPEKLVFNTTALDGEGQPLLDVLNTVSFVERDSGTRLT
jgi:uncharacterized protein YndB with AHSA1/START domain